MVVGIICLGVGIGVVLSVVTYKIKRCIDNKYNNDIARYYSQTPVENSLYIPKVGVLSFDNIDGCEDEIGNYTEL